MKQHVVFNFGKRVLHAICGGRGTYVVLNAERDGYRCICCGAKMPSWIA